jgi:hypothetical protein
VVPVCDVENGSAFVAILSFVITFCWCHVLVIAICMVGACYFYSLWKNQSLHTVRSRRNRFCWPRDG